MPEPIIDLSPIDTLPLNERAQRASKEIEVILEKYQVRFFPVATLTPGAVDMAMKFADAKVVEAQQAIAPQEVNK